MLMSITAVQSHASLTKRAEKQTAVDREGNQGEREWKQTDEGCRNMGDTHGNSFMFAEEYLVKFLFKEFAVSH